MALLVLGLLLFLGVHSTRILVDPLRTAMIQRMGARRWKGLYSLLSLLGFVLIVLGFRQARAESLVLWISPGWMRHVTALLMILAMVLFFAAYIPGNWFKARWHHPQVL